MTSRSDLYGEVEIEVRVGVGLEDQAAGQLGSLGTYEGMPLPARA